MRTKTQTVAIAICFATLSMQFIACKKDEAVIAVKNNTAQITNAAADSTTDSSLTKGLVAWYTFNGDVLDHSGFHNDIVFNSAKVTKGKSGALRTAYLFDGVSSYMQVNNSKSLNPLKISVYALVKPRGFYQGTCHSNYVLCKEYTDYDQGRYLLGFGDQAFYNYTGCDDTVATHHENFFGAYGDGGSTASGLTDLGDYVKLNQWYSIVYTFDGVYSKLYVNGVLKTSATQQATTFTPSTTPLFIGKTPNSQYPYYFNGYIDEIRIYKKALTANQVMELYNSN